MSAGFLSILVFGVAMFLALDVACFAWLRSDAARRSRPVRVERVVRSVHGRAMWLSDRRFRR
jgi:hypothetical protein